MSDESRYPAVTPRRLPEDGDRHLASCDRTKLGAQCVGASPCSRTASEAESSNRVLLAAYYSGDNAALDRIYRRWFAVLYRFFRRQHWPHADSLDLVQETFWKIARYPTFNTNRPFAPWIFRVARNVSIDACRRRRSGTTCSLSTDVRDPKPPPNEIVDFEEEVAFLLNKLDARSRVFFQLWRRGLGSMNQKQIAQVLGVGVSTARKIQQGIIRVFRERYFKTENVGADLPNKN